MKKSNSVGNGALAGALGGLIGSWAMSGSARLTRNVGGRRDGAKSEMARLEARRYVSGSEQELDSIATASDFIDAKLFGHRLSPGQKSFVAAAVHYAAGIALGAAYGAVAEVAPLITRGRGMPFGVCESVLLESIAVPALTYRLRDYSRGEHVRSVADHAVYGFVLETTRRALCGAS